MDARCWRLGWDGPGSLLGHCAGFCGADGSVVVAQAARWIDPATGADHGQAQVASHFCVEGGGVARYARYENLEVALTAAGLDDSDEVIPVQRWP